MSITNGRRAESGHRRVLSLGSSKPGRYRFAHFTDLHFGSDQCDKRAALDFLRRAHEVDGCEVVACTGDVLDGCKDVLKYEQKSVSFDRQADDAVDLVSRAPKMHWAAIDGNHDGYFSSAIGFVSGQVLEQRMRAAGVAWTFLGKCLGRAVIHGAKTELWHPAGAASKANSIRIKLNDRIEHTHPSERCDILINGHFHHWATVITFPENVLCVSGGTFQRKGTEFANRISAPWDIGGGIISFSVDSGGRIYEKCAEFRHAKRKPSPWRVAA